VKFEILLLDLKGIFTEVRPQDFGGLVFWVLWIIAVLASLRGVDRRDEIAQVTYMGAVMALGVVLILILPFGSKNSYGPIGKVVVFSILLLVPSIRWIFVRKRTYLDQVVQNATAAKKLGKKE
jgi:hypothetical protein